MKKEYMNAELQLVLLQDVIITSGTGNSGNGNLSTEFFSEKNP